MSWVLLSVVIALTTTSAYKFPYPRYYEHGNSQNYGTYRRVDEGSLEQDTGTGGYQGRSSYQDPQENPSQYPENIAQRSGYQQRSIQSNYQGQATSSQYLGRSGERAIPYSQRRGQDQIRVAPLLDDAVPRNGNTSLKIMNSLPKTYPLVINRRGVDKDSAVVFPGPTSGSRQMFTPQKTDNCGELGICENSPDYPHEYVEALLAKLPDADIRFNLDVETPEIAQRGGHEQAKSNRTVELCKPDFRIIYPDKATTKSGNMVFIVNSKKNKVQGFRGTMCRAPGKPCEDLVYFPPNYKASCEQKTMDRYMWALNAEGEMELVTIPMPSCCSCVLQAVN